MILTLNLTSKLDTKELVAHITVKP